jgi:hypothetical protein
MAATAVVVEIIKWPVGIIEVTKLLANFYVWRW